ncbi:hypothetical protein V1498_03140 [Peribacillus sp. SCS-26]|uniref:hypothetical protein n=1 Tax=Paraperibacillus marinus TaxID=3115295 RepID=UPI00390625E7
MFRRSEPKFKAAEEMEVEVENIFEILPPPGTIIGEATEEEMDEAADLESRHMAFMRLQDMNLQLDGAAYKDLLKEFQEFERDSSRFWRKMSRRLSVPYEWPIRIDHANGPIYMGEHDFMGEEEEEV